MKAGRYALLHPEALLTVSQPEAHNREETTAEGLCVARGCYMCLMNRDSAVTPRPTTRLTMVHEIRTPSAMDTIDLRRLMPNTQAASAPVQAPVTGRGIATKTIRPQYPYFSTLACTFARVRSTTWSNRERYQPRR